LRDAARGVETAAMTRRASAILLLSISAIACSSSTTTTSGGSKPTTSTEPTLTLPAVCEPQSSKLTSETCDDNELLVACPTGTPEPSDCKRSVYPDSYCCAIPAQPAPASDPAVVSFCDRYAACPDVHSKSELCQAAINSPPADCVTEASAVIGCLVGSKTDACNPAIMCAKQMASFFACHAKATTAATCTYAASPEFCGKSIPGLGEGRIELVCTGKVQAWNGCQTGSQSVNGVTKEYLCCDPSWFAKE